jgi:hypothetical protein
MSHHNFFPTLSARTARNLQFTTLRAIVVFLSFILLSLTSEVQAQTDPSTQQRVLSGHANHKISLKDGAVLTRNFRNAAGNDENTITGEFFGKDALIAALSQDKCIGLRIYFGKQTDGNPALVFVGVDPSGNDMTDGFVGDDGFYCPPFCGTANPLTEDAISISGLSELRVPSEPK